jgi:hypothetical protein
VSNLSRPSVSSMVSSTGRLVMGISKTGAAKHVEGHHDFGSTREAPQRCGKDKVKLGFCALKIIKIHGYGGSMKLGFRMLKIVKIHGYGGSIYRVFRSLTCVARTRT